MTGALQVPEPRAVHEVVTADGYPIALRRYGNPDGPRVVMSRGNCFAMDAYWPFWSRFADDFDVFVHDVRSHGRNPVGDPDMQTIPTLAQDFDAVSGAIDRRFGARRKVDVFHSLAALTALHAQATHEYAALVLFDPPIQLPGKAMSALEKLGAGMAAATRRRRDRFATPAEYAGLLSEKPAFARLGAESLELFARTTLRPGRATPLRIRARSRRGLQGTGLSRPVSNSCTAARRATARVAPTRAASNSRPVPDRATPHRIRADPGEACRGRACPVPSRIHARLPDGRPQGSPLHGPHRIRARFRTGRRRIEFAPDPARLVGDGLVPSRSCRLHGSETGDRKGRPYTGRIEFVHAPGTGDAASNAVSRIVAKTVSPASAHTRASARPIPVLQPVMRTTLMKPPVVLSRRYATLDAAS